ncbi:hypothetical protein [Psychrobacillus sp. OK032]|uniref:hypothetical protein n=1 Tax=Psychrobacillus sp. OK032 TaxID=1884358 RepID=UPI0008BF8AD4|nr:hypothetical protein [Psychrobacillus sp. OK032]SES44445.1 hypothetical protein SAMN05518872_11416 [Psychrobacillus sp. OK032]
MLIEILANIGLTISGFIRGMPKEEKINRNIDILKTTEWFHNVYQENEEFFLKDDTVRYIIGWNNVDKSLRSEKRTNKLRVKILDALDDR